MNVESGAKASSSPGKRRRLRAGERRESILSLAAQGLNGAMPYRGARVREQAGQLLRRHLRPGQLPPARAIAPLRPAALGQNPWRPTLHPDSAYVAAFRQAFGFTP